MIVDLFSGPGGWDEGLRMLGHTGPVVGVEWDADACRTAKAAGHARIRADVAALHPTMFADATGLIASPPCQAWSMAGKRKGEQDRANCHTLADRMAAGDDSLDWTDWEDPRSPLVCQPVRWVRELRPEWVALEEVPAVASLWEHFARIFRGWGYSVWTGDLCAADYGVPQTRTRRILIASRVGQVTPPVPTHAEDEQGPDLFGGAGRTRWVSMHEALGWSGVMVESYSGKAEDLRTADQPAWTITSKGLALREYVVDRRTNSKAAGGGMEPTVSVSVLRPAPTLTGKARSQWVFKHASDDQAPRFKATIAEAGVLQSFPVDYPWHGQTDESKGRQVGNAVPPLLAAHVLAQLVGLPVAVEVAA